jgi:hypothetical protein
MATLTIPEQTLARLRAAAAARHVSVETYLDELASADGTRSHAATSVADRIAAADSIRKLAAEIKDKVALDELIAQKHADHKY